MISGFFYQYGVKYLKNEFDINSYKKYLLGKFLQIGVPYLLAEISAFVFQIIRLKGHITLFFFEGHGFIINNDKIMDVY